MTVFLTQSDNPDNIEVFLQDQDLLLQLVQPVTELFVRKIDYETTTNVQQITYVKNLAQEVLVVFSSVFKQQLLEVLLECLMQLSDSNIPNYDKFCDRLESDMLPYIISHGAEDGEGDGGAAQVSYIELKLPYMAIIEQRMDQEEAERME